MCVRYLGFVLLACFPGLLHAQSATQPCSAPRLNDGYLVPEQNTYNHGAKLTYACDNGHKPAVEGWWATSTCQNGRWSSEPQCIDEKACIAPDIPNAEYTENQSGWYNDGKKIRITCNKGYDHKDRHATTTCINGTWSSVLVCEKNIHACGEPPQIPHAVIILQGYQDFFAADTGLQYECEDGFTVEGGVTNKYVYCVTGNWTKGPVCKVETGGRQTTSAGSGTQPEASRPATGPGGGSTGSGTQPAGGGTSTTWNERDNRPLYTTVKHCGANVPNVPNGDVVEQNDEFLKYQCKAFYKQVGSDIMKCYNNGSWSQLPICQAPCFLDPADLRWQSLILSGVEYIKEGEIKAIYCDSYQYRRFQCINGETNQMVYTPCCGDYNHRHGYCR